MNDLTESAALRSKYKKHRRLSVAFLCAVCVFSLFFGTWRSVSAQRDKVEEVFYGDMGIDYDLKVRSEQAYNMVTVANKYLRSGHEAVEKVLDARMELDSAGTISEKYSANKYLTEATASLDELLSGLKLEDKDRNTLSAISAQLMSSNSTIGHNEYNSLARRFNTKIMGSFPAGILARLTGIKKLELFT